MTNPAKYTNILVNLFSIEGLVSVIRIALIAILVIYTFLAFILTRQVKLMNSSFKTPVAPFFTSVAFFHLVLAALLAIIALLVK